eukprot:10256698-Heterocapsa_arctica.AAC.1
MGVPEEVRDDIDPDVVHLVWPPVNASGRIPCGEDGPRDLVQVGFGAVREVASAVNHVGSEHIGSSPAERCVDAGRVGLDLALLVQNGRELVLALVAVPAELVLELKPRAA